MSWVGAIATTDPEPETCQYSNLGPALLGQLLATAAGRPYKNLIQTQVLTPLGLTDTHFDLDPETTERLAQGHRANTLPTAHWQLDAYAPAGGLKSTLTDMGRFLAAAIAADWPPLALSLQPHSEDCGHAQWVHGRLLRIFRVATGSRAGIGFADQYQRCSGRSGRCCAAEQATAAPLDPLMVAAFLGGLLIFQGWQFARSQRHRDRLKFFEDSAEILLPRAETRRDRPAPIARGTR